MVINELLKQDVDPQLPLTVDEVSQYFGSMVRFKLSNPSGWRATLRVNLCDWALMTGRSKIADSDSSMEINNPVLGNLRGKMLVSFEQTETDSFSIIFSDRTCLIMKANLNVYEPESTLFHLWINDEYGANYSPKLGYRTHLS